MPIAISTPQSPDPQSGRREGVVVIGLINNMPDAALRSTERQFFDLIAAASGDMQVCLRLFTLPEVPRGKAGRAHISKSYEDINRLWQSRIDGLIVTGTEPRAAVLADEPYWPALVKLVDWAEDHTFSTIWSCLAAHAAVLYLDGISRRALRRKLSGTFDCRRIDHHSIMFGVPTRWRVPHSRYNEVPEEALVSAGYRVLSRSSQAGVDIFVRQKRSLFIFFQGHPEYDPGALLREYRRDSTAFVAGIRSKYPEIPCNYFDEKTKAELLAYRERTLSDPACNPISNFPHVTKEKLSYDWFDLAIQLYKNWFSYLIDQKEHGA
jgi:homoserine O-succinyltransferase/O-acetyltransferase